MCWTVKLQNSFNKLSNCENWQTYQTFFCKFCDCNFTSEQKTKERTYQITTNLFFPNLSLTVTCKLSLRISELVPVRKDGTMLRESSERHRTNPACNLQIVNASYFYFIYFLSSYIIKLKVRYEIMIVFIFVI